MSSLSQLQQRQHFSSDDDDAGDLADLDSDAQTISIPSPLEAADASDLQIDYDDTIDRSIDQRETRARLILE